MMKDKKFDSEKTNYYGINNNTDNMNDKNDKKKIDSENSAESNKSKRYWYFPFFSTNFPTQKVKACCGNIWWTLSVGALVFIWCFQAVTVKNWLFLILGLAAGAFAEYFIIRDFINTKREEKAEQKDKKEKTEELV